MRVLIVFPPLRYLYLMDGYPFCIKARGLKLSVAHPNIMRNIVGCILSDFVVESEEYGAENQESLRSV